MFLLSLLRGPPSYYRMPPTSHQKPALLPWLTGGPARKSLELVVVTSGQTYTAIACCPRSQPRGALVLEAQRVAPGAQWAFTLEQRLHLRASEEGRLARIRRQVLGEAGSHLRPLSLPLETPVHTLPRQRWGTEAKHLLPLFPLICLKAHVLFLSLIFYPQPITREEALNYRGPRGGSVGKGGTAVEKEAERGGIDPALPDPAVPRQGWRRS